MKSHRIYEVTEEIKKEEKIKMKSSKKDEGNQEGDIWGYNRSRWLVKLDKNGVWNEVDTWVKVCMSFDTYYIGVCFNPINTVFFLLFFHLSSNPKTYFQSPSTLLYT